MAFVKHGDDGKIVTFFDDNGNIPYCPSCGKKLVVMAIEKDENKLICSDCDISDEDKALKN